MASLAPETLVPGKRYLVEHRRGELPSFSGRFIGLYTRPTVVHAQFNRLQGPNSIEAPTTEQAVRADEWTFHETGDNIRMRRATESGALYNALPDNILGEIRKYGGAGRKTRVTTRRSKKVRRTRMKRVRKN